MPSQSKINRPLFFGLTSLELFAQLSTKHFAFCYDILIEQRTGPITRRRFPIDKHFTRCRGRCSETWACVLAKRRYGTIWGY